MKKVSIFDFNKWKDEIKKSDFFLDIGCWDGSTLLEFKKKCNSFGMDIDDKKLKSANLEIKDRLKKGDATKRIPFNKKFNWIYLSEVIEHVKGDSALLKNISKSMKTGGKLILTTPKSVPFFEFWDPAWVRWKFGGQKHYHYKLKELENLLKKENLYIKKYAIRGNLKWVIKRWLNVFLKFLLKSDKKVSNQWNDGFAGWMIYAEKIK